MTGQATSKQRVGLAIGEGFRDRAIMAKRIARRMGSPARTLGFAVTPKLCTTVAQNPYNYHSTDFWVGPLDI